MRRPILVPKLFSSSTFTCVKNRNLILNLKSEQFKREELYSIIQYSANIHHVTYVETRQMISRRSLSAQVPIITVPRTLVLPNPVFISIHILSGEPSIQSLLQIIQVLRLSVRLSLGRARIVLGHTWEPLYYLEEPPHIETDLHRCKHR
jgi:hypothetical protein